MNGPDELRELADEMDADKHSPEFFAAVTRTAADAWEEQLADAWASFHRAVGRALNTTPQGRAYLAENAALRQRLDAARLRIAMLEAMSWPTASSRGGEA